MLFIAKCHFYNKLDLLQERKGPVVVVQMCPPQTVADPKVCTMKRSHCDVCYRASRKMLRNSLVASLMDSMKKLSMQRKQPHLQRKMMEAVWGKVMECTCITNRVLSVCMWCVCAYVCVCMRVCVSWGSILPSCINGDLATVCLQIQLTSQWLSLEQLVHYSVLSKAQEQC